MTLRDTTDEDADEDDKTPEDTNRQIMGLGLIAGAGLFLTMGDVIVQYTYVSWPQKVSTFEVLFAKCFIQLLLVIPFIAFGKVKLCGRSFRDLIVLNVMAVAENANSYCLFLALTLIPLGDATVIQFTAPVFTVAFSYLFFKKGCSVIDTFCGITSFGGVILLARPTILFSHKTHPVHTINSTLNSPSTHLYMAGDVKYLEGIGYSLIAAACQSIFFIMNKATGEQADLALNIFYPSFLGVIIWPIFIAIKHTTWFAWEAETWVMMILLGFMTFVGLMFTAESLQLEEAGPAIILTNLEVVYAFLLQYAVLKVKPTMMSIIGSCIVLSSSSLILFSRKIKFCQKISKDKEGCEGDSKCPLLLPEEKIFKRRRHSNMTL